MPQCKSTKKSDPACSNQETHARNPKRSRRTSMNTALSNVVRRMRRRGMPAIAGLLAVAMLLTGCSLSSSSPATALATNQQILRSCDATHTPAAWVGIDGTGSSATDTIFDERMTALQTIVQQTAVCSGYLKVVVFTSSSTATATLFDGSLRQTGETDNARLQRVPKAVTSTMTTIENAYAPALKSLNPNASDITGQYVNAAQWIAQLGSGYQLHLYLLTDGFQNVGIDLNAQVLDQRQAQALAQQAPASLPSLPGSTIVVAGIGRIVDTQPPSAQVQGMTSYYTALCHRMEAQTCMSVTDYQAAGL